MRRSFFASHAEARDCGPAAIGRPRGGSEQGELAASDKKPSAEKI
jgi:hypothetical protein